jgi:hypothetical protein
MPHHPKAPADAEKGDGGAVAAEKEGAVAAEAEGGRAEATGEEGAASAGEKRTVESLEDDDEDVANRTRAKTSANEDTDAAVEEGAVEHVGEANSAAKKKGKKKKKKKQAETTETPPPAKQQLSDYTFEVMAVVDQVHPSMMGVLIPQDAQGRILLVKYLNASNIRLPLLLKALNGMLQNPLKLENQHVAQGQTFDSDRPKIFNFETKVSALVDFSVSKLSLNDLTKTLSQQRTIADEY